MTMETSNDVLADSAPRVIDAESFQAWVEGPLQSALPHQALYCGQSIAHSGGFAAIQKWSFGVPQAYLDTFECAGGNVRSPVLTRLIQSGGPEFYDLDRNDWPDIDRVWRDNFIQAGWRNLLWLSHREGEGDQLLFTSAAFYGVAGELHEQRALQLRVMTTLHQLLCRVYALRRLPAMGGAESQMMILTRMERPIVQLLLLGKTNKEIGAELGKSAETIKTQLANLMKRLGVRNRTELVHWVVNFRNHRP